VTTPVRGDQRHWDDIYAQGDDALGWSQSHAAVSMSLITEYATELPPWPQRTLIDIGAGASTLADDVMAAGCQDITVLDLSPEALAITRARLGRRATAVTWTVADLTTWQPQRRYDVWHDRAVLHFLVDAEDRASYRRNLLLGTAPGSLVVIGGFGPEGAEWCSQLPVRRLTPADMKSLLGDNFEIRDSRLDEFTTPSGAHRQYLWTVAIRQS
jgi:Methyltransferase domain